MDFNEFSNTLICKLQLFAGNEYVVERHDVPKNNGVTLHGIMAKKPDSVACPTFYIDDMYDDTMQAQDIEYLALKLHRAFVAADFDCDFDMEEFFDFDKISPMICMKLINAEMNKDMLFDVPYRRFFNLAVVYFVMVENKAMGDWGSILIRNSNLEEWGKKEEDLFELAQINTPRMLEPRVDNIVTVLNEYYGKDFMEEQSPMYIMTNKAKMYGAGAILYPGLLKEQADRFGGNFYIIPSSVHEVLLLPENKMDDPQSMLGIIADINRTQVDEKEVLANSLYEYCAEDDEIIWVG